MKRMQVTLNWDERIIEAYLYDDTVIGFGGFPIRSLLAHQHVNDDGSLSDPVAYQKYAAGMKTGSWTAVGKISNGKTRKK